VVGRSECFSGHFRSSGRFGAFGFSGQSNTDSYSVTDSSGVGKIVVGKIKRGKGMTKISYSVVPKE